MTPRLTRLDLGGLELEGFAVEQPAASVRLLLPSAGSDELVMPAWNGNEFLLPDGGRPTIRTFTPLRVDPERGTLAVEIVVHGGGAASEWAVAAEPGAPAAISGPGRGYVVDDGADSFLLAGDETAIPAIRQLFAVLPAEAQVQAHVEIVDGSARLDLPERAHGVVEWHELGAGAPPGDALVAAVRGAEIAPEARIWAAGEAAAVQRIRHHLFEERDLPRSQATVRGYWKHGRSGDGEV